MTDWATQFEAGDVAWLLIMTVLPLALTLAGFALVVTPKVEKKGVEEKGVKVKGVEGIWARMPLLVASLLMAWSLWIYSLAYGPSWGTVPTVEPNASVMRSLEETLEIEDAKIDETVEFGRGGLIGGLDFVFLNNVFPVSQKSGPYFPVRRPHTHIPHVLECLFRWTSLLLAIVPLWVVWSERFQGAWLGVLGILWSTLVFAPIAHWVWGDGWLEKLGTIDFGGGLLVLAVVCSGISGTLRRSPDTPHESSSPSGRQGLGTMLLWLGLALFICAQTFHADGRAGIALLNVLLGTSAGVLVWSFTNGFVWKRQGLDSVGLGLLAGVAGMSSAAGVVLPQSAIVIGAFTGLITNCWFHLRLRRDGAGRRSWFSTFGVAAASGMLGTGVFATTGAASLRWDGRPVTGLIEGDATQLLYQLLGIVSVCAWSFVVSWLLEYALGLCHPSNATQSDAE